MKHLFTQLNRPLRQQFTLLTILLALTSQVIVSIRAASAAPPAPAEVQDKTKTAEKPRCADAVAPDPFNPFTGMVDGLTQEAAMDDQIALPHGNVIIGSSGENTNITSLNINNSLDINNHAIMDCTWDTKQSH